MRSVPARVAVLALLSLASCASDTSSTGLALNDPLDLIDDVEGPLRLFVVPAPAYTCDRTTGRVAPEVPDVEQGSFGDAVIDITLEVSGSRARGEVQVPAGDWTVLVRGKGTDPVTGVRDTFIATGCAPVAIRGGETVEIRITLLPIVGMGVCGDSVFSPDEQCEDGNTAPGDGCSATCRTEPFVVSTTAGQSAPAVGGAAGRRWVATYTNMDRQTSIRLLEPNGGPVTSPSVLRTDALLETITTGLSGQYLFSDTAVATNGRIAASVTHFSAGAARIRVAFFNENRTPEGGTVVVRDGLPIASEPSSSVAFAGNGAFLVVFEDAMSATGLSGQVFAAGSSTALGEPFPIGQGTTGAAEPRVAGAADHFVVAFAAGGDVYVQRFGTDGAARDAMAVAVLEDASGTQDQPSVAVLSDGRALVTWREGAGAASDGAGSSIRARALTAAGAPAGAAFVLNTTTAGDQTAPRAAGLGEHFVVVFQNGASVRARLVSGGGEPIPNREQPPTTADFEVAATGAQPSVATGGASGTPRALVTWAANGDVHGRLFSVP
jgi:cysteine-rich repeat protein